jgi:RND superfamily putative drug exporter
MFQSLGRLIERSPRSFVIMALCLLGLSAYYGRDTVKRLHPAPGWEIQGSDAALARAALRERFGRDETPVILLMRARQGLDPSVDSPAFRQAVQSVIQSLTHNPDVRRVESYYDGGDARLRNAAGDMTFALVWLPRGQDEGVGAFQRLRAQLAGNKQLDIRLGGELATYVDMREALERDVPRVEWLSFLLLIPALIWVFGSVVAAALPLVIGGCTVVIGTALLKACGEMTTVSIYATHVVSMLGLGLAIDYGLFIVSRFREELARGNANAVTTTLMTAGRTVAFSGTTVAASVLCLYLLPQRFFHNMALAAGIGVSVAMLTAILVLPALLAILGRRIERLSVPLLIRRQARREARRRWYAFSHFVMRRAVAVLLTTAAVLLALGVPLAHLQLGPADHKSLPIGVESRVVQEIIEREFPHAHLVPLILVARTEGPAHQGTGLTALHALGEGLKAMPDVDRVVGLTTVDEALSLEDYRLMYAYPADFPLAAAALEQFARGDLSLLFVHYTPPPNSDAARELAQRIRALPLPDGMKTLHVGGFPADQVDYMHALRSGVPWVIAAIVIIIFILLFLMLGSVVLPVKAVLANLLSLSATFGGLVWIFQDGHLSGLLGFTPQGQLDGTVLVLIFATAFSLAIDYEVFLLSRVKEASLALGDDTEAVATGIQKSGPIITSAALLIGLVLASFATADAVFMKATAVGLLISVAVDATVVRMLLVPATLRLLGAWNWWAPRPLKQIYRCLNPDERAKPHP